MTARRHWGKVAQFLLAILVIGLAGRYLVRNWTEFQAQRVELTLRPGWLMLALATVLATFGLLIEAWRRVVVSQGESLAFLPAARIWLLASLGKYIPGKVWAIAGAAIMAEEAGVRRSVAVTAALVLQALALGSGAVILALTAPGLLGPDQSALLVATTVLGVAALAGVGILCWGPGLDRLSRLVPESWPRLMPMSPGIALAGLVANSAAWAAYGAALLFLARGLMPADALSWRLATAVFTASYLVGLVALFAPAGVGPRESLFILLLSGPLGPKAAVGLAVASRILLTLTEVGAALPFLLLRRAAPHGPNPGTPA